MKQRKWLALSLAFLLAVGVLAGCGNASNGGNTGGETAPQGNGGDNAAEGESRVFKIAHIAPESHAFTTAMNFWKEELEEQTEGRLSIEIYPGAQLGIEPDYMQQMQAGSLDMAWVTVAEMGNRSEVFSAWFMPFIVKDFQAGFDLARSEEAMKLFDTLDPSEGVHGLGYTFAGMRHLLMKNNPIVQPDDLAGQKIRVTPNPVITEWWSSLGAGPTPVPLPELYTAFQTGVVDGMDIDLDALVSSKFYEVGKQFTISNHTSWPAAALISQKTWDDLSAEDQQIVESTFASTQEFLLQENINREESNLQKLKDAGGVVSEIDQSAFADQAQAIQDKYAAQSPEMKAFIEKGKEISGL